MTGPLIEPLVLPADADQAVSWQVQAVAEIERDYMLQILGSDDLAQTGEQINTSLALQQHTRKEVLLAHDPQRGEHPAAVVGIARLTMPLSDNTHIAMLEITVRPEHRRRGIGNALWQAAEERIRAAGRTHVLVDTSHPGHFPSGAAAPAQAAGRAGAVAPGEPVDSPQAATTAQPAQSSEQVQAPGAVVASHGGPNGDTGHPGATFAMARGFVLAQVERHSVQPLPIDPKTVATLRADAAAVAGEDYELISWTGPVPRERLGQIVTLRQAMSTDIPLGDMDLHAEAWDGERVRREEQVRARWGRQSLTAAVCHVPSGDLAGYTEIHLEESRPQVAYQENTVVLRRHRGHRLGMLLKAANLTRLQAQAPAVRRVHTWNADENEHMLAINTALGYRHTSTWANWQLTLN